MINDNIDHDNGKGEMEVKLNFLVLDHIHHHSAQYIVGCWIFIHCDSFIH